ncbi:MAG: 50S ribosomal protein L11 methyltransferase [Bdellovibrionaceae bacterium]|nr:50S ribosomal protein L11 methyltransferase [Pseudobdellovibrionaceae bacterium]MDW8190125.1 50S ribosomal protein L11 methyltransferase [Pseudobdellovibrionaceae bacterium]
MTGSNPSKTFFKLVLRIPSRLEEAVVTFLSRNGALGFSQNLPFEQPHLHFDPVILDLPQVELTAFFDTKPSDKIWEQWRSEFPQIPMDTVQWLEEPEIDWLAEWKKGFRPIPLTSGGHWVVPSWLESPVEPDKSIRIDPGMAFGTGTHATTRMAAQLLYEWSVFNGCYPSQWTKKNERASVSSIGKYSLLDVGTGTGILAILAEKLGFAEIVAHDIDPEALRVARENIAHNNCDRVRVMPEPLTDLNQIFDVVVANIVDGVLLRMQKELMAKVKLGGALILSGILLENEDGFWEQFVVPNALKLQGRLESEGWVALCLRH